MELVDQLILWNVTLPTGDTFHRREETSTKGVSFGSLNPTEFIVRVSSVLQAKWILDYSQFICERESLRYTKFLLLKLDICLSRL